LRPRIDAKRAARWSRDTWPGGRTVCPAVHCAVIRMLSKPASFARSIVAPGSFQTAASSTAPTRRPGPATAAGASASVTATATATRNLMGEAPLCELGRAAVLRRLSAAPAISITSLKGEETRRCP